MFLYIFAKNITSNHQVTYFYMVKEGKNRLPMVVRIITEKVIGSQEELAQELKNEGFNVTQATLSRDLKLLKVSKIVSSDGYYRYVLPKSDNPDRREVWRKIYSSDIPVFHAEVLSLDFSHNLAVVKTRDNYGQSLAYDIDLTKCPDLFSTVSGADTVICPLKAGASYDNVINHLRAIIPSEVADRAAEIYGGGVFKG